MVNETDLSFIISFRDSSTWKSAKETYENITKAAKEQVSLYRETWCFASLCSNCQRSQKDEHSALPWPGKLPWAFRLP